jgi:glucose dehydrogenase
MDVKSGNLLWRYGPSPPAPVWLTTPAAVSRSLGDKVYFAAGEAAIVALDAKPGEVWTTSVAAMHPVITFHLRAGRRRRMVGTSGGEFESVDLLLTRSDSGKELWRIYQSGPGESGSETGRWRSMED